MKSKIIALLLTISFASMAADVCIITNANIGTSVECNGKSQLVNAPVSLVLTNFINNSYVFVGQSPTANGGTTYTLIKK